MTKLKCDAVKPEWCHDELYYDQEYSGLDGIHQGTDLYHNSLNDMKIIHHEIGTDGKYELHLDAGQTGGFDGTLHSSHESLELAQVAHHKLSVKNKDSNYTEETEDQG